MHHHGPAGPPKAATQTHAQPAVHVAGAPHTVPAVRSRRQPKDLNDPARIGAISKSRSAVKDRGGDVSLTAYMTLPLEQYFVLDPKKIVFLGANRFLLKVPRINLFNLYLEPEVEVSVVMQSQPPRVILTAENCRIKGSPSITNLRIDEKFCLSFVTELSWTSTAPPSSAASKSTNGTSHLSSQAPGNSKPATSTGRAEPLPQASTSTSSSSSSSNGSSSSPSKGPLSFLNRGASQGSNASGAAGGSSSAPPLYPAEIFGTAQLDVWSEVVTPFQLVPRPALIASCNVVMRGLVESLLPVFTRQLASDYEKWATDADYRLSRAARDKPLGTPVA